MPTVNLHHQDRPLDKPKKRFILVHDQARDGAREAIANAPDGFVVTITPPAKTRDQEEHYHAIFGQAARACTHLGKKLRPEAWKRLLVDQFRTEMLQDPTCPQEVKDELRGAVEMIPSLDGESIVSVGLQTREFKKRTAILFIEWLQAFMAERGIDPPTIHRNGGYGTEGV